MDGKFRKTISNTDIARKFQKKSKICRQNNWIINLIKAFSEKKKSQKMV